MDKLNLKPQDWVDHLEKTYHLGRANKDDYGLVQVNIIKQLEPITPGADTSQPNLVVWLLSDTLLRDKRLRYSAQLADLQNT